MITTRRVGTSTAVIAGTVDLEMAETGATDEMIETGATEGKTKEMTEDDTTLGTEDRMTDHADPRTTGGDGATGDLARRRSTRTTDGESTGIVGSGEKLVQSR